MDNKTAYAIVEVLGEALVRRQEGIDNCLEHIAQLDSVNQRLISESKKMKEEILSLKSESSAPVKVADCGRFDIAQGADRNDYENTRAETCCDNVCGEPDCCENIGETPYGIDG